jgi:hypothetical protein
MHDRHVPVIGLRAHALPLLALVSAALLGCLDDKVTFGPPQGLRRSTRCFDEVCPIPAASEGMACPDFATQVFPLLDDPILYGCTLAGCHGDPARQAGFFMPAGDADSSYDNMAAYVNPDLNRPYVSSDPADKPYFLCNLSTDPEVNACSEHMPTEGFARVEGSNLAILGAWALCNMPKQSESGAGGEGVGGAGAGGI